MNDRLENFVFAYELSRRAKRIIGQNITIALGTVIVMALLAVSRGIPLSLGVVAHEGSTVIVVLNSLRLLFMRADR
jgi:Cd2+/Zn2+-exporting ATPase